MNPGNAIRPIGGFYRQRPDGSIINPSAYIELTGPTKCWTAAATAFVHRQLGHRLHSFWLRGSYARNAGIYPHSDLDLFILLHDPEAGRWTPSPLQEGLRSELREQCGYEAPLELMQSAFEDRFKTRKPRLAMLIATQSRCLYGTDLTDAFGRYYPGPDLALNQRWWPDDVAAFLKQPRPSAEAVRQICKQGLRTAFESVMETAGCFTTDLFYCTAIAARYRPELAAMLWQLLWHYSQPEGAGPSCQRLLRQLGHRL